MRHTLSNRALSILLFPLLVLIAVIWQVSLIPERIRQHRAP